MYQKHLRHISCMDIGEGRAIQRWEHLHAHITLEWHSQRLPSEAEWSAKGWAIDKIKSNDLSEVLTRLGDEGWELISWLEEYRREDRAGWNLIGYQPIFKRPKQ